MSGDADPSTADEATKHLFDVLRRSGVPFEAAVASDCQRFARDGAEGGYSLSASRVLYGDTPGSDRALREVDQVVGIYTERSIADVFGLQVLLEMPIECKHRDGLSVFGFAVDAGTTTSSPLIVAGEFAHSSELVATLAPVPEDLTRPVRTLALVTEPKGGKPRVLEEHLAYKAASSLVDFIATDAHNDWSGGEEQLLGEVGMLGAFDRHIAETSYHPASVAQRWALEHLDDYAEDYAERYFGGRLLWHMLKIYCPVVCVDGKLFDTVLDSRGELESAIPTNLLFAGARTAGWPHLLRTFAPRVGPETVVAVTNREGLDLLLRAMKVWFARTLEALESVGTTAARRMLLEAGFLSTVRQRSLADGGAYRSDLDLWP